MQPWRPDLADSEKITINMSVVDLGKVDLLVSEGFYANRTDFIRSAIRRQLDSHAEAVTQSVVRQTMVVGVVIYNRRELERLQAASEQVSCRVVGLLTIEDDVPPELAAETIASVRVYGVLRASKAVKQALAGRIH